MGDVLAQEMCQRPLVNLSEFSFKIPIIVRGFVLFLFFFSNLNNRFLCFCFGCPFPFDSQVLEQTL